MCTAEDVQTNFDISNYDYSYLTDDRSQDKKAVIKRKLKFENYKSCLEATQLENK